MSQKDNVIEAMRKNGGYATFQQLNQIVDFSTWKTKTPQASIRQIVQVITLDDEWRDEKEWDAMFEQLQKDREISD